MASGVYQITNKINGKFYIGSSDDLWRRRLQHYGELRRGAHANQYLQRAFYKYGEEAFEFTIVKIVDDVTALVAAEQLFLDTLRPVYNICKFAYSPAGLKHSENAKRKISEARKGIGNGMYRRRHSEEAVRKISIASQSRLVLPETQAALVIGRGWNRGIPFSEDSRRKMSDAKPKKPVVRIDIVTGGRKYYECASAARKDGFSTGHIGSCCKGRRVSHKGFYWEYAHADPPSKTV